MATAFGWRARRRFVAAGSLTYLLRNPEMVALLAASPQIVRLLRPLCRARGVDPGLLSPRPRKAESLPCTGEPAATEASPLPTLTPERWSCAPPDPVGTVLFPASRGCGPA